MDRPNATGIRHGANRCNQVVGGNRKAGHVLRFPIGSGLVCGFCLRSIGRSAGPRRSAASRNYSAIAPMGRGASYFRSQKPNGVHHSDDPGGPDSLPIGAAKPQEVFATGGPSCACGTPIAELSGPPQQAHHLRTHNLLQAFSSSERERLSRVPSDQTTAPSGRRCPACRGWPKARRRQNRPPSPVAGRRRRCHRRDVPWPRETGSHSGQAAIFVSNVSLMSTTNPPAATGESWRKARKA